MDEYEVPGVGRVIRHTTPITGHQGDGLVRDAHAGYTFADGSPLDARQELKVRAHLRSLGN